MQSVLSDSKYDVTASCSTERSYPSAEFLSVLARTLLCFWLVWFSGEITRTAFVRAVTNCEIYLRKYKAKELTTADEMKKQFRADDASLGMLQTNFSAP